MVIASDGEILTEEARKASKNGQKYQKMAKKCPKKAKNVIIGHKNHKRLNEEMNFMRCMVTAFF